MLELDGSTGGGQLLRTALSLSAVTGDPFEMTGVRGDRPDPGLKPQHLAAVPSPTPATRRSRAPTTAPSASGSSPSR
jgi:RNA 3'-terminal phosphate cyclase (ATP)